MCVSCSFRYRCLRFGAFSFQHLLSLQLMATDNTSLCLIPSLYSSFIPPPPSSPSVFAIIPCGCLPRDNFILTACVPLCQRCWCMCVCVGEAADRHGQQGSTKRADPGGKRGHECVWLFMAVMGFWTRPLLIPPRHLS